MTARTFIIMGRSGSGKGTQSELLRQYLAEHDSKRPMLCIETGADFRQLATKRSLTARKVKSTLETGSLLPYFLAIWNWSDILVKKLTGHEHLVIDGAPRMLPEAEALESAFEFYGRSPVTVFWVDVSVRWATERLTARGRADDLNPADIKNRLDWFDREVLPAINFFKREERYEVIKINGEQSVAEVHEAIVSEL